MSCTPTSGLEPFSASMCAPQLARIMLLSNTRCRHIVWGGHENQDLVNFANLDCQCHSVRVETHPRFNHNMADAPHTRLSAGRQATRATNADQHPGRVDQIRKRCTKAEIARTMPFRKKKRTKKSASKPKVLHTLRSSKTKWPLMMLVPRVPTHETKKVRRHTALLGNWSKLDVNIEGSWVQRNLPSREQQMVQQPETNQRSHVTGPKQMAKQKRKRGEETSGTSDNKWLSEYELKIKI